MYFVAETDEVVKETKIIYHTYRLNPVGDGASTSRRGFCANKNRIQGLSFRQPSAATLLTEKGL